MNHHTLIIHANNRPETMERLLRITRHRGFMINSLHMNHDANPLTMSIQVSVSSERPLQMLETQLSKLWDVTSVVEIIASSQPHTMCAYA